MKLGKEHLYVWEIKPGFAHENEAGIRIAQIVKGAGLSLTKPSEGKVNLIAEYDGLCSVNEEVLYQVNMIEDIVVATINNRRPVKKGDIVAGVRVIPLLIQDHKIQAVEQVESAVVSIKAYRPHKVGIITTGNEVYQGRITDAFGPVIKQKVEEYGCEVIQQIFVPDDAGQIADAVKNLLTAGAELILATGGMSVDPDDVTPSGIRQAGAEIVTYGAPVLPGSMFLMAYLDEVPIMGLPGCVMYARRTIFDIVLPRVMARDPISVAELSQLGEGGLCLDCKTCVFPNCGFGKGW
ncbi:hypothetical protein SDC9_56408 [bioreactor metagenome]|uniref:MoaB/Mog domain-containing protein n=1 Tax=bioreactor metagenome TaxID=1076179 RepID=A0A644X7F4_9ZZZZ